MSEKIKLFRLMPLVVLGLCLNAQASFAQSSQYIAGVKAMALNNIQSAIYNFDQAVTNDGTDFRSFLKRGQCLYELGDYKLAIADFNQVLTLKPRNEDAMLWRANSYAKLGQADKALNDYKALLSIDPIKLALVSQKVVFTSGRQPGPVDEDAAPAPSQSSTPAATSADSSSSSSTTSSISSSAASAVAASAGTQEPLHLRAALFASGADKIGDINSAISMDPKNPTLLFKRARAYIQLKKYENAVNDLSDALMNNPNNASYYLCRALVYHLIGTDVLATEDIKQAQFCDPGLPKVIDFDNSPSKS
ncbi:MAG: tetratricopeptide repeat protein [Cyanobacteria bacterium SZAS-4]|nr:tetratricopeptide repeat protein [Cyanobacteria bacterium SZAS-4]